MVWQNVEIVRSTNENVAKYVFTNTDAVAEAVLYRYPSYADRTVICCSTQSGCPVGCRFCGAGDAFMRSLTADEIVAQPTRLIADTGIESAAMRRLQIMFMSMGEPLLNMRALVPALRRLHSAHPNAALLISTSAPRIDWGHVNDISKEIQTIGLQFSIHESTDEARDRLIPFKAKETLAEIALAGEEWALATGRQPFFNYCVHERNNTVEDAERLAALFSPDLWQATISVICERDEHVAAANERQRSLASDFRDLLAERGYSTRVFDPAGQDDIGGGCGQLWYVQNWMQRNAHRARGSVGAGRPAVHAPRTLAVVPWVVAPFEISGPNRLSSWRA
jgi:23S rRNA (adenine2503-C2)-methyltransferase